MGTRIPFLILVLDLLTIEIEIQLNCQFQKLYAASLPNRTTIDYALIE